MVSFQRKRLWPERWSIIAWWLKLQYNRRTNRRSYTIPFAQVLYKLVVISTKKFDTLKIRFIAPLVWKNTSYTQQKIRHVLIFWGLHLFLSSHSLLWSLFSMSPIIRSLMHMWSSGFQMAPIHIVSILEHYFHFKDLLKTHQNDSTTNIENLVILTKVNLIKGQHVLGL